MKTAQDIIDWFTATEIVRHNGTRDDREPMMSMYCARLLSDKVGQPSYYRNTGGLYGTWTAHEIWEAALRGNLFMTDTYGWIDRMGRFWGCGFAEHELLLHFLDKTVVEAEQEGWVRISMSGAQALYQPSGDQLEAMSIRGMDKAAVRLLDLPKPPRGMRK